MVYYDRAAFLPDILLTADATFSVTVNATPTTVTIGKGSWFANALVFWLTMCDVTGGKLNYIFEDTAAALTIRPDSSYTIDTVSLDAGATLLLQQTGDILDGVDGVIPHGFYPQMSLMEYGRGVDSMDGVSAQTQDGLSFTVSGLHQDVRTVRLSLFFDNVLDNKTEPYRWLRLWRHYWRKGRSVSCYPLFGMANTDNVLLQAHTGIWGDTGAGRFESLVIPYEPATAWKAKYLVSMPENKLIQEDNGHKFYVRRSVPASAAQPQILRLTSWVVT